MLTPWGGAYAGLHARSYTRRPESLPAPPPYSGAYPLSQYLSPIPPARHTGAGSRRRPPSLHAVAQAYPHRQRRVSGFQPRPLRKITPEGVTFRSHIDGSTHFLSPEKVVEIQLSIGSDIQMVLDVCPPYPASRAAVEAAMVHTTQWAFRAREAFARNPTCYGYQPWQFGIVQGGVHPDLREAHFQALESIPFEGWAVGGLAVGEPFDLRKPILHQMGTLLPSDKPRYVMGFGSPQDILEAIAAGMDMMDCVLPTRNARHGLLYTWEGIRNLRNARYQTDFTPIPPHGYTRAYLHHLFRVGDPLALVLTTEANLHFFLSLLHTARQAILAERFTEWRAQVEPQLLYRHPPEPPSKRPPAETTP